MQVIVGSTGLIGKTLKDSINFDLEFNSSNINNFPDIVEDGFDLYLCCLPAAMWLVNKDIPKDIINMTNIINVLKKHSYRNVYLFSTIEVYNQSPEGSDENYTPSFEKTIYGHNRYMFELLVKDHLTFENIKIFRLPALFGKHLKKNIFFDLLNNHEIDKINTQSIYQWYNLKNLSKDVELCFQYDGDVINLFGPPIPTAEIIKKVFNMDLENKLGAKLQNFKTIFSSEGYWSDKNSILDEMKELVDDFRS